MSDFVKVGTLATRRSKYRLGLLAMGVVTAIMVVIGANNIARADSMSAVTSTAAQQPNDSVMWSQLGSNAAVLSPNFSATSVNGVGVSVNLTGANSLLSVVCPASSCNWSGNGMASGDSLIWTNNGANGGNGPVTINFSRAQAGAGAFIQSDGPSSFTAKIEAFNASGASLGSFTETSDSSGHAIYLGILDRTAANIAAVTFSLTQAQGSLADFALDRLYLNNAAVLGSTPTIAPTAIQPTRTATPTATPTALSTSAAGSVAFVGSTSSTTASLTVPAGVQNGDLLLAFYSYWSNATATAPAGWTLLHSSTALGSGVESVWYRFASNDAPGALYTWTFTGSPFEAGGMLSYRGANSGSFEDGFCLNQGNSPSPSLCSFNDSTASDVYVAFFATENTNLTLPGDLTTRVNNQYVSGSHFGVAVGSKNLGAAGNVPADSGSMNSGGWATVAFAIKAKPTGATPTAAPTNAPPPPPPPPTRTATATVNSTPIPAGITFVGSTTTSTTTQTVPGNVQNGDLLLGYFSYWSSASATAPSGWTLLHSSIATGSGVASVWYRFASNDANASYTWSFTGTPYEAGGLFAFRGVAGAFEDGSCTTQGRSTAPSLCSFATTSSNDTYVGLFATENLNLALPSDLIARQITPYLSGAHFGIAAGTKSLGAPGLVPADTGFMSLGGWASVAFALRPANGGGSPPTPGPTVAPTSAPTAAPTNPPPPSRTPTATATPTGTAITLVGTTSSTTASLTIPNGVANGDLLLAFYSYWSTVTVAAPSGWTLLHTVAAPSNAQAAVWYRFANGDAPGAANTWNFNGGAFEAGGMLAYRGVSAASFEDGYCATEGVNSAPGLCSFTANFSHDTYVALFATGSSNLVLPADLTSLVVNPYAGGSHFGVAAANKSLGASGVVPAESGFMSAGGWASIAIALKANGAVP